MFARKTPEIFEAQIRALLNRPDAAGILGEIRCPALLLSGHQDSWSPPSRHTEMAAMIPGPPGRPIAVAIVSDCGHMSTIDQPKEVAAALRALLQ
jgi:pimeloyl-ACP methyl ester carboxylesterase